MRRDFLGVTELGGDEVALEQVERLAHRYLWAAAYCEGRDVLEVACGSGQGLGLLATRARRLWAGDISRPLLERARRHYGERAALLELDAQRLPFPDASLDEVLLFEAIYYLPDAPAFVAECRRVLRPGGHVLIASANPDLWDFNPSPYSVRYYGVVELAGLFAAAGLPCRFFGHLPVAAVSLRQRLLRPIKKVAASLGLIPKTMAGKKWLKRLVFGGLVTMPAELEVQTLPYLPPTPLPEVRPDRRFKVIYAAATKAPGGDALDQYER
jgi:SAM-dependent methyltransferase